MDFSEAPVLVAVNAGWVEGLEHGGGGSQRLQVVDVRLEVLVEVVFVQELTVARPHVGHPVAVVGASRSVEVGAVSATPVY